MVKVRTRTTTKESIVKHWFTKHSGNAYALLDETELNVDACDSLTNCWRCGSEKKLEMCHIVPHALGGKDEPKNYVLLCHECHKEAPNVIESKYMIDWLIKSKTSLSLYGLMDWVIALDEAVDDNYSAISSIRTNDHMLSKIINHKNHVTDSGKMNHSTRVALLKNALLID